MGDGRPIKSFLGGKYRLNWEKICKILEGKKAEICTIFRLAVGISLHNVLKYDVTAIV